MVQLNQEVSQILCARDTSPRAVPWLENAHECIGRVR